MTSEQETAMYDQPSGVSREALIEEIKGMVVELTIVPASIARTDKEEDAVYDQLARDLVARFEKVHTPTDDYGPGGKHENCYFMEHNCTPANVSEPGKTDVPPVQISLSGRIPTDNERAFAWAEYRKDYEPNPAHFIREAVVFQAGWDAHARHRTVQGEPSDAQVEVALRAYWGGAENAESHGSAYGMRAALRAAAAAQGGETR